MINAKTVNGIKWEFLTGDVNWMEHGGTVVSVKQNNGEFDYWLVIEWVPLIEYDEFEIVGSMEMSAVAPSQFENLEDACPDTPPSEMTEWELVNAVRGYAGGARTDSDDVTYHTDDEDGASVEGYEKEIDALLLTMQEEAVRVTTLFGFYMDKYQNGVGSTGWDFLKGDVMAGLSRMMEAGNE